MEKYKFQFKMKAFMSMVLISIIVLLSLPLYQDRAHGEGKADFFRAITIGIGVLSNTVLASYMIMRKRKKTKVD